MSDWIQNFWPKLISTSKHDKLSDWIYFVKSNPYISQNKRALRGLENIYFAYIILLPVHFISIQYLYTDRWMVLLEASKLIVVIRCTRVGYRLTTVIFDSTVDRHEEFL